MKNSKTIFEGFLSAAAVLIYVFFIAYVLTNGEAWFGAVNSFFAPAMILMLFVVSALITASLVFAKPIYLYFEGKKKQGIELFFSTASWLIAITVLIFAIMILTK